MHWGAPKTWYGVPGHDAERFEAAMREAVPELIEGDGGLLYKMVTMVPPQAAHGAGVSVCRLLQKAGSFVITWPRAYHAGFSHGLNCAESSNFATADWLPWGRASVEAFCAAPGTRRPCFTHEMLLLALSQKAEALSPHIATWVGPELRSAIEGQLESIRRLRERGVSDAGFLGSSCVVPVPAIESDGHSDPTEKHDGELAEPDGMGQGAAEGKAEQGRPVCELCEYECFFSSVEVPGADPDGGRFLCLAHALEGESALTAETAPRCRLHLYRPVPWLQQARGRMGTRAGVGASAS